MSTPVRILAVGNMYPPHHQGGYELVWQSAMRHAREIGCEVRVLVSTHRDRNVRLPDEPGVYRTLRWYWDWERHSFPRLSFRDRVRVERANAAELRRHLAELRPDVVTWWSMGHMSLSLIEQVRRRRIPAVFSIHNDWLVYGWTADQWIRMWTGRHRSLPAAADWMLGVPTRVDLGRAGRMLFNSRYTMVAAQQAGVDIGNAEIIHPGISSQFSDPIPSRPWQSRVLYVGRIDRAKGVDTAVSALAVSPVRHPA